VIEDKLFLNSFKLNTAPENTLSKKKWSKRNSQAWKKLIWARDKAEDSIKWNINSGSSNFWWDS